MRSLYFFEKNFRAITLFFYTVDLSNFIQKLVWLKVKNIKLEFLCFIVLNMGIFNFSSWDFGI